MSAADPGPLPQFGSPLAGDLTRFLQFQRAAGYRYREEADALRRLDRFLAIHLAPGDPVITRDLVRASLARRGGESETTREHRLSLLRQFCRFLALREPRTTIPPPRCLGIRRRPFVARVLSRAEGRQVLQACAAYPGRPGFPLRGVVHGTALILLYLTGLRVGEAVRLTVGDVDLPGAVFRIRDTKFGKTRLVPLAADLSTQLPLLATYLGHVGLTSSQRYLQLTADLRAEVTRRHQARFGHLITEGRTP